MYAKEGRVTGLPSLTTYPTPGYHNDQRFEQGLAALLPPALAKPVKPFCWQLPNRHHEVPKDEHKGSLPQLNNTIPALEGDLLQAVAQIASKLRAQGVKGHHARQIIAACTVLEIEQGLAGLDRQPVEDRSAWLYTHLVKHWNGSVK